MKKKSSPTFLFVSDHCWRSGSWMHSIRRHIGQIWYFWFWFFKKMIFKKLKKVKRKEEIIKSTIEFRIERGSFDQENSFETVVVDSLSQPSGARKLVNVAGYLVSNVNAFDHPSRRNASIVVADDQRRQWSKICLALIIFFVSQN